MTEHLPCLSESVFVEVVMCASRLSSAGACNISVSTAPLTPRPKSSSTSSIRVGDSDVDKRQVHIDMDGLALLNDLARCVMLHIVGDAGLWEAQRGEDQDNEGNEQQKHERDG